MLAIVVFYRFACMMGKQRDNVIRASLTAR